MNKYCPECYTELKDNESVCPNCGYIFAQELSKNQLVQDGGLQFAHGKIKREAERIETEIQSGVEAGSSFETNLEKKFVSGLRQFFALAAVICFIVSGVFFYKAYDVKTNYYNSEDFYSLSENAYVGGDAYNYIINGTYFTGYAVIASAFFISGILLITCNVKTQDHFIGEKK